jgi:hypothetical protein
MTSLVYEQDHYYRHKDGGIYFALDRALSTVDRSEVVVYRHVFPFEPQVWVRPLAEWTADRFTKILKYDAIDTMMKGDREALKAEITAKRTARKG